MSNMEITEITPARRKELQQASWQDKAQRGLFICHEAGEWLGISTLDGEFTMVEFETETWCRKWLNEQMIQALYRKTLAG